MLVVDMRRRERLASGAIRIDDRNPHDERRYEKLFPQRCRSRKGCARTTSYAEAKARGQLVVHLLSVSERQSFDQPSGRQDSYRLWVERQDQDGQWRRHDRLIVYDVREGAIVHDFEVPEAFESHGGLDLDGDERDELLAEPSGLGGSFGGGPWQLLRVSDQLEVLYTGTFSGSDDSCGPANLAGAKQVATRLVLTWLSAEQAKITEQKWEAPCSDSLPPTEDWQLLEERSTDVAGW